jgi:hypothetical protein
MDLQYRPEPRAAAPAVPAPPRAVAAQVAAPPVDIDRLGRDVWRQLERRLRVERERRGRA